MNLFLVKPKGRQRLWRVENRTRAGRVLGFWRCDSEEIARELIFRVGAGKAPGFIARDLRVSAES